MVSTVKGHTWVLGDFNYPKFCWADNIPTISPDCKHTHTHQYEEFIDLLNEFSLKQLVTQPTRFENILDLFLIDNPTLVKSVDIKPGIADHDAVLSEDSRLCLFYKIIYGLVAIDMPPYVVHPLRTPRNSLTIHLLPSNSNHCRLLQILILSPLNRAMEPAASTHSTSVHL